MPQILIVDDQPNNLQVAGSTLNNTNKYKVHFALNGEEALEQIKNYPPDLILLDVMMPGLNGYDVCQKLKQDPRYHTIPIIFLTAMDGTDSMVDGFKVGGADYITKPFEPSILLARVETHLQLYLLLKEEIDINHELEKRVAERTQELIVANRTKDEFLATMSHELRTPLTSIIGNSELLAEVEHDPGKMELLGLIEMAGRNQLALVNDVLDMSKIQSGTFTLDETPYDFVNLIGDIGRMLSVRALDAGLGFVVEQKNHEDHLLLGDAQRIKQILINIVGNAIKFTEKGEVKLTTWVDKSHLMFEIRDSGIGMSPEAVDRLFQHFEQADGAISRGFGGSGLGLYISKNLTDLMGGWINVTSREEEGSTFLLALPYHPSNLPIVKREERTKAASVLEAKLIGRVLIAEDTPEMQLLERRILEGMGLTVAIANNGREAVDLASTQHFDLILMDMQMPEVDGIEATKILRSQGNPIPIVALTANVMQKHRDLFHEAGCDGFLAKPIDKKALRQTISPYLTLEGDEKSLERKGISDSRKEERRDFNDRRVQKHDRRGWAPRRLQDRVERAINRQSSDVDEFIDDDIRQLFFNRASEIQRKLKTTYARQDWEPFRFTAHTLKGSGTSFGFPKLTEYGKAFCDAYDLKEMDLLPEFAQALIDELGKVLSRR